MSSHDQCQLLFLELMGSTESAHAGQFRPYGHLKTHGQALHLYKNPETHQELFFRRSISEWGFGIIEG